MKMRHVRARIACILEKSEPDDTISICFNVFLISLILINVLAVILESVEQFSLRWSPIFSILEIGTMILFSLEYFIRLWCITDNPSQEKYRHPLWGRLRYMRSPLAIIDLVSVAPFWLSMFIPLDLRFLRVVRLLRVLKLTRHSTSLTLLLDVIKEEASVIGTALFALFILLILASSGIYLFEHKVQPEAFANIPQAMWWGVVTVTTVGYGDIVPVTPAGKLLAAALGFVGVGMVALPAGIMASGFSQALERRQNSFKNSVKTALADGVIDSSELAHLRKNGSALNLSQAVISEIIANSVNAHQSDSDRCPYCNRSINTQLYERHG